MWKSHGFLFDCVEASLLIKVYIMIVAYSGGNEDASAACYGQCESHQEMTDGIYPFTWVKFCLAIHY